MRCLRYPFDMDQFDWVELSLNIYEDFNRL